MSMLETKGLCNDARRSVTSHFRTLASRITMSNCALFKSCFMAHLQK